ADDGIRAFHVTGLQTRALPISAGSPVRGRGRRSVIWRRRSGGTASQTSVWIIPGQTALTRTGASSTASPRVRCSIAPANAVPSEIGRAWWRERGEARAVVGEDR